MVDDWIMITILIDLWWIDAWLMIDQVFNADWLMIDLLNKWWIIDD